MAKYNLSRSQSDRINYDESLRVYFSEMLRGVHPLRLRDEDSLFVAYFDPDEQDTDDPDEARARALAIFRDCLQSEITDRAEMN